MRTSRRRGYRESERLTDFAERRTLRRERVPAEQTVGGKRANGRRFSRVSVTVSVSEQSASGVKVPQSSGLTGGARVAERESDRQLVAAGGRPLSSVVDPVRAAI